MIYSAGMDELKKAARVARFGVFELDFRTGELRKQGLKIKLQDQPFEVLAMLLRRPREVITREELQKKLWPADTFVDFAAGLNKAINRIREALGDSADNPRFIETLPRRGYRFIMHVTWDGDRSRRLARGIFLFVQLSYVIMYGITFYYLPQVRRLYLTHAIPFSPFLVALWMLCGAAVRIYLFSAVAFDFPGTGSLFGRLFPAILVLDAVWATSPLLLFRKMGELALLGVAGLAFLPFAQRTLVGWAYPPG